MNDMPKDSRLAALLEKAPISRPQTPDFESQQGRRNASAQLLDAEGAITPEFETVLGHIFAQYATPVPSATFQVEAGRSPDLLEPAPAAVLDVNGIDRFALATNGQVFSDEAKEELQLLDCSPEGHLTFNGFLQMYQLQTENDEEETWKDLSTHGFDRNLKLVSTRQSVVDEDKAIPMNELGGIGMGGEQIR